MTLRRRLLLLVLGLSAAGIVTASAVSVFLLRSYVMRRVDSQLESYSTLPGSGPLSKDFRSGAQTCSNRPDRQGFVRESPAGYVAQAYFDGDALCPQDSDEPGGGPRLVAADFTRNGRFTRPGRVPGHQYRVQVSVTPDVLYRDIDQVGTLSVVYAIDMGDATRTWKSQALATSVVGAVTLIMLGAAAAVLVRRDLRPLERVASTAEEIAQGDLSRRVEIPRSASEVGRLGTSFNTMVDSIEQAFADQRKSEQKLRRFVADASHELRTPLTSIRGYAELERAGGADTPDKRSTVMRHIDREARRMSGLVEDMLLLAKLDEEPPLRLGSVELGRIASDAVNDLSAVEPDRPVELSVPYPVEITADEARMRQVLANLLGNVRSHTPAGTPVRVTVERMGDQAEVRVIDRGPGIPPDKVDDVFERFTRLDPSRARTSGGSGLGLAIVRALAEAHHGGVSIEPTPGGGATFVVRLPVAGPAAVGGAAVAASGVAGPGSAGPGAATAPGVGPVLAPPDPGARVG